MLYKEHVAASQSAAAACTPLLYLRPLLQHELQAHDDRLLWGGVRNEFT